METLISQYAVPRVRRLEELDFCEFDYSKISQTLNRDRNEGRKMLQSWFHNSLLEMSLKTKTFRYWIHLYLYNNSFILHVKRNIKSHLFSNSVLLVCFPYILLNYWFSMFYEKAWGFRKVEKIMEKKEVKYSNMKSQLCPSVKMKVLI